MASAHQYLDDEYPNGFHQQLVSNMIGAHYYSNNNHSNWSQYYQCQQQGVPSEHNDGYYNDYFRQNRFIASYPFDRYPANTYESGDRVAAAEKTFAPDESTKSTLCQSSMDSNVELNKTKDNEKHNEAPVTLRALLTHPKLKYNPSYARPTSNINGDVSSTQMKVNHETNDNSNEYMSATKLCSYPYNQCNQQWDNTSQYPSNSLPQSLHHQFGPINPAKHDFELQPLTPNTINQSVLHPPSPTDSPVSDYMDEMKTPPSTSPNKRERQINQMCKNAMSSPESGLWIQNGTECMCYLFSLWLLLCTCNRSF